MRANLLLLFGAIVFCLITGELVVRYVFPLPDERAYVDYHIYRFDKILGWTNQASVRDTIVEKRLGVKYNVSINSFGMREKEVSLEKDSRARIAFLGDSMLWGLNITDGERFSDLIGENPNIESLNFGVAGFGPVHYYLQLDDVIKFKPDLVVLTFTLNNDWLDNIYPERYTYYKPYAAIDEKGELAIKGYPLRDIRKFAFRDEPYAWFPPLRKSALAVSSALAIRRWRTPTDHVEGTSFNMIYYPETIKTDRDRANYTRAIYINQLLLEKIRNRLAQENIPLLLIATPTACEYNRYCELRREASPNLNPHSLKPLAETARVLNIEFLDLMPFFSLDDFFEQDTHYTPAGHRRFATHLEDYLKKTRPEWFAKEKASPGDGGGPP